MTTATASSSSIRQSEANDGYPDFERLISAQVAAINGPLFTTDADELFQWFLTALPAERRQHYTCHCCRRFIETYGGLVTIDESGATWPILWDASEVPPFFANAIRALFKIVLNAKVTGVFLSKDSQWGNPKTGEWTHLCGVNPKVYRDKLLSADQKIAEKKEDYGMLCRGLADFAPTVVAQAVRVLEADALDRSEKTLGIAKWMQSIHTARDGSKNRKVKDNVTWLAVATAPPGYCHVRTTMISTLLEDLAGGMDFAAVAKRWADKMHPLKYQRPVAPPKAGNIAQAEKIFETLGLATSLRRRFARRADLVTMWTPKATETKESKGGGVFDHLRKPPKSVEAVTLPEKTLTWEKFRASVLPNALAIDVAVPDSGSFFGMVTAADNDAPPILQWDGEPRNPVSWYFRIPQPPAFSWNLRSGAWAKVNAVTKSPAHWHSDVIKHQGEAAFIVLEGCKDLNYDRGTMFFPEILKSELREVSSVMEAHSRTAKLEGIDEAEVSGLGFHKGTPWNLRVRVTDASGIALYRIDRWE